MDCLEAMKQMSDNAFDLAVVDPPYGDGSQVVQVERDGHGTWSRFGQRFDRYKYPVSESKHGGGWHGKNKYHLGALPTEELPASGRDMGLRELAAGGATSTIRQKNHNVGRRAGSRVFRGTIPRLTKPDYMGRQLFSSTADKVFSGMAKADNQRIVQYGDGRICVDFLQRKRESL